MHPHMLSQRPVVDTECLPLSPFMLSLKEFLTEPEICPHISCISPCLPLPILWLWEYTATVHFYVGIGVPLQVPVIA